MPTAIENALKNGRNVKRIGGANRYATVVAIAAELETIYGKKPTGAYLVRSDVFADALSVGTVAAIEQSPILYVLGGKAAVSDAAVGNLLYYSAYRNA